MGRYDKSGIMASKRVYDILKYLSEVEESYSKEISEELGMNRGHTSELLRKMEDIDLIYVSSRDRAKNYKLYPQGFRVVFRELWDEQFEESSLEEALEKLIELHDLDQEEVNQGLYRFVVLYMFSYLGRVEESTVKRMMVEDFRDDLKQLFVHNDLFVDAPNWIKSISVLFFATEEGSLNTVVRLAEILENYRKWDEIADLENLSDEL